MASLSIALTGEQKAAIDFKGPNVLVSAAAGSGKTFVLVEKVVRRLLAEKEPSDIHRLLVVTFTEKAAMEMKERIRSALQKAGETGDEDGRIARQLSLLERAQISTIHSFCLAVTRRYFHKVRLDPGFRVLDVNEANLLRYEALDEVFEEKYGAHVREDCCFLELVEGYGGSDVDEGLKQNVLRFHEFLQTQPYPAHWLNRAFRQYEKMGLIQDLKSLSQSRLNELLLELPWTSLVLESMDEGLKEAVSHGRRACAACGTEGGPIHYLPVVEKELSVFEDAHKLVSSLRGLDVTLLGAGLKEAHISALDELRELAVHEFGPLPRKSLKKIDPRLHKTAGDARRKAKDLFTEALSSLILRPPADVLQEIQELMPFMKEFTGLALHLDRLYRQKKMAQSGVDFSDLERYCLQILKQDEGVLAQEIRSGFDYIFVDEYQDTNPVQEEILSLVSSGHNLFMVGDIKQSIYRFRLADPGIFLQKYRDYHPVGQDGSPGCLSSGARLGLSKNFRSRKQVIDTVNYLFERIMREDVAEIDYTEDQRLVPGAIYPQGSEERLISELLLIEREDPPALEARLYEALEKEALVVASKIKELVNSETGLQILDKETSRLRKCKFKDIAILMRSVKGRANAVLDILQRCGIPAYSQLGTGYFRAREIEAALSILEVVDNPRQDIPLAAVLRSPAVGLTPKQLAYIKALCPDGEFYDSVKVFASLEKDLLEDAGASRVLSLGKEEITDLREIVARFLKDLKEWRELARRKPLAHVLWAILRETRYYDYVGGLPGGAQRQANLRALVNRAMEFDKFGRHGLFRFLRYIDRMQESRGDLGAARALGEKEDVVQVLSVHKAKGLEFPIVFVIDLGKLFNMEDLRNDILFHKDQGVGAVFCDLPNRIKYPTLPFAAHIVQIKKDNLAEEMRVFYVAMTRAREKLYLVGSARDLAREARKWMDRDPANARSFLDWLCPVLLGKFPEAVLGDEWGTRFEAENADSIPFDVHVYGFPGTQEIPKPFSKAGPHAQKMWDEVRNLAPLGQVQDPEIYAQVKTRLEWKYAHENLTYVPAKMSVGELKSRLEPRDEFVRFMPAPEKRSAFVKPESSHGIERGTAIHALLAEMDLSSAGCEKSLQKQLERLSDEGFLDKQYISPEDLARIARFFRGRTGRLIAASPDKVKREIPFTMKINLRKWAGHEDSVLIQGVIDFLAETREGLLLLDYKTDSIGPSEVHLAVRNYTPQVALYALALEKILKISVKHAKIVFLTPEQEIEVDWRGYLAGVNMTDVLSVVQDKEVVSRVGEPWA